MIESEVDFGTTPELTADMIRAQLDLLVRDEVFRSSKRSVAFLKYVVEQTLNGSADQIKERTIGVEVFSRDPSYDTNLDHIVRTAATELRKRLATYYVDEKHRSELRIGLTPGSYIPRFMLPGQGHHPGLENDVEAESPDAPFDTHSAHVHIGAATVADGQIARFEPMPWWRHWYTGAAAVALIGSAAMLGYSWLYKGNPERSFLEAGHRDTGPGAGGSGRSSQRPADVACGGWIWKPCHSRAKFGRFADCSLCRHGHHCQGCGRARGAEQAGPHPQG